LFPLVLIAMARIEEIAAVAFGRGPRRLIGASAPLAPATMGEDVAFPEGLDPHPRLFRAGRDLKQTPMRCRGSTTEFRIRLHHQQHAIRSSGADPGSLPDARRAL